MKWFFLAFQRIGDFRGRSRRKEFFGFFALVFIAVLGLMIAADQIWPRDPAQAGKPGFSAEAKAFLDTALLPIIFASFIAHTPVSVRRMHDIGRSGWNYLWVLIPYIGFGVFLIMAARDGDPFTNEYGPDPKGRGMPDDELMEGKPARPLPAARVRVRE